MIKNRFTAKKCDSCGASSVIKALIPKPLRFLHDRAYVEPLVKLNQDGRPRDLVCLDCLNDEIEVIKNAE